MGSGDTRPTRRDGIYLLFTIAMIPKVVSFYYVPLYLKHKMKLLASSGSGRGEWENLPVSGLILDLLSQLPLQNTNRCFFLAGVCAVVTRKRAENLVAFCPSGCATYE